MPTETCQCDGENGYFACPVHRVRISEDVPLNVAVSAMRAWDEQLSSPDGTFGLPEVKEAIRGTLSAVAATCRQMDRRDYRTPCVACGYYRPAGNEDWRSTMTEKSATDVLKFPPKLDTVSAQAETRDKTVQEEWAEIILLQGMLVDRIDRLVVRAGCKTRRELMLRLARRPDPSQESK